MPNTQRPFYNIAAIWQAGLCVGCGTCVSACPQKAVIIKRHHWKGIYFPEIDERLCNQCGYCLQVCPGQSVDFQHLAAEFLDGQSRDELIGIFNELYIGHASSCEIRFNASSGGLVTSLLIYALERKMIDAALVVTMNDSNPLETQPCIATTPDEIIAGCGSKYCPSAPNVKLRDILANPGRYAVVGLPCHVHAIRKWQSIHPALRQRIFFVFGLFCANNNTYLATEYFLKCHGIDPGSVSEIRYRSEGWPGKIRVTLKDGTVRIIPRATTERKWYRKALFASAFHYDFMIPRCLLCPDQTSELADISFGDPWLSEYKPSERIGVSLVIVRNQRGSELVSRALNEGIVCLQNVALGVVKRAQNYSFKAGVGARIRLRKNLRLPVPDYPGRNISFTLAQMLGALRYIPSYFSYHRWLWPAICALAVVHYLLQRGVRKVKAVTGFALRRLGLRRTGGVTR